ncbi:D-amino acid aminotransferase [Methylobacillus gramineus]|uniref:D-amino acid aminotransferase n=1 Tax=Methylobacillus gramineus TaxID=755169 RepID=UPI001D0017F7|nr:D-amino acid aminotransferase [Methylobacillus gramineus]MCB5185970.1 D-amino acid aminotransferase [Methylobacillus gramineus]
MSQTVYLNGTFLPLDQATIPVLDRGFIFGDGVYEVIPVYSGQPFRLDEHLQRLQQSLQAVRIRNPLLLEQWHEITLSIVKANAELTDQSLYLHITRGVAPRDQAFPPAELAPTVLVMSLPLETPAKSLVAQGVEAISALDIRWDRCHIKAISLLANVLLKQQAVDAGVAETIMFREGMLTEGTSSNIFAVEQGVLLAPPKDQHMLPGITYDVVLELAATNGIEVSIGPVSEARIRTADELWMTSSTKEVLAIISLDNQPIGTGQPGPLFKRMYTLYQNFKNTVMRQQVPHG